METKARLPLELRAAYLALHRCSGMQFAKLGVTADQFVLLATLERGHALKRQRRQSKLIETTLTALEELRSAG